jgi:hypothetical protein
MQACSGGWAASDHEAELEGCVVLAHQCVDNGSSSRHRSPLIQSLCEILISAGFCLPVFFTYQQHTMSSLLRSARPVHTVAARSLRLPAARHFSTDASAPSAAASATAAAAASRGTRTRNPSMKESSTEAAQRSFALRLYKAIMRAHKTVLPEAMRSLGDTYVREEFKLHKTAKPQHLHGFFTAWIGCQ